MELPISCHLKSVFRNGDPNKNSVVHHISPKVTTSWGRSLQRGIYGDRLVCQADLKKLRQLTEKISKQMWLAETQGAAESFWGEKINGTKAWKLY